MITAQFKCDMSTEIGRGSYGAVFLGLDRHSGQQVAVKRIENDDEGGFYMSIVEKEISILKELPKHEHIVEFLSFYKDEEYLYFITEYCNGLDLATYLLRHQPNMKLQLQILRDCASALNFMHNEHHIIHRDVKPTNVLVRDDDGHITVKLSDFAFARVFQQTEECEFLNSGFGHGSLSYMAPELFDGVGGHYTTAIDVFSMGLVYLSVIGYSQVLDNICKYTTKIICSTNKLGLFQ